jgi:hypothetical protein
MGGCEVDVIFTSVARRDTQEDGLADVSQQAYLEYTGRDTDSDYVNDSLVLRQQVKTILEESRSSQAHPHPT